MGAGDGADDTAGAAGAAGAANAAAWPLKLIYPLQLIHTWYSKYRYLLIYQNKNLQVNRINSK